MERDPGGYITIATVTVFADTIEGRFLSSPCLWFANVSVTNLFGRACFTCFGDSERFSKGLSSFHRRLLLSFALEKVTKSFPVSDSASLS